VTSYFQCPIIRCCGNTKSSECTEKYVHFVQYDSVSQPFLIPTTLSFLRISSLTHTVQQTYKSTNPIYNIIFNASLDINVTSTTIAHNINSHLKFIHKSIKYNLSYFLRIWNSKQVSTSPLIRDALSNPKNRCTFSHHLLAIPCNTTKVKR